MAEEADIHDFTVTIISAENLDNTQLVGTQDPFVSLKIKKKVFKTSTDENGGSVGHWNESFTFENISASFIMDERGSMTLKVMNKNVTDT